MALDFVELLEGVLPDLNSTWLHLLANATEVVLARGQDLNLAQDDLCVALFFLGDA